MQGERQIRGSGIYSFASLLNHDCMPNLARFDEFDSQPSQGKCGRVEISFRALHDIPHGEELTVSYFPLTLDLQERQQRCCELYGFKCTCLRCQVSCNVILFDDLRARNIILSESWSSQVCRCQKCKCLQIGVNTILQILPLSALGLQI